MERIGEHEQELRRDGTDAGSNAPARGYSWPPFEKGHMLSVKHGARSPRLVAEKAAAIRAKLLEKYEYLADDTFDEALRRYVRIEARAQMLDDYIAEKATSEGVEAVPRTLWDSATRADALSQKAAQDCGLDPTGHARIARDLGFAKTLGQRAGAQRVAALAERGRQLREGES